MTNLQKIRSLLIVLLFLFLIPVSNLKAKDTDPNLQLNNRFRLVWLQDQGDGRDVLAQGKSLVLYGYDSEDGKGERRLINRKGSYYLPLFTPDGQKVIFSDRRARKMFLLDWESGKIKELGDGVAVEVWQDTKRRFMIGKPRIWVYCFSGPQREFKNGTKQPLYRFPLDNPEKKELIWDKTVIAWSNLQLSRDGEIIGGLFPWPNGGILWQKDKRWQRFGRGCWASLSPDNSKLLWIFDGLHRNVQMYDVMGNKSWKVNINDAPGINGFEVYHPRWSNHPRFFVITGPYDKGEGSNKIGGGSENVEIYIGRFNVKATRVEKWLKVTQNSRPDFFPELWIDKGEQAELRDELPNKVAPLPAIDKSSSWPVSSNRMVFIWDNMKAQNQLSDSSPVGFLQCNIDLRGRSLHTRDFQVSISEGWGDTGEAGHKIGQALAHSRQAAIEFTLTPDPHEQGVMLSLSRGKEGVLQIVQDKSDVKILTDASGGNLKWKSIFKKNIPLHFVVNVSKNNLELFVNGKSKGKKKARFNFSAATIDSFSIGEISGEWAGVIEKIGIYDQVLPARQIAKNSTLSLHENTSSKIDRLHLKGSLLESTVIPDPESIGAYSRALVINTYTVDSLIEGSYKDSRILVAEWAVLDRQVIKTYDKNSEELVLEKFSDHPELEGERQMMDIFEPDLDLYYRLP